MKYDLDDLFHNPPIFDQPIERYEDVLVNPHDDNLLTTPQANYREFNEKVKRHASDAQRLRSKNYWEHMVRFISSRKEMLAVIARKDEY